MDIIYSISAGVALSMDCLAVSSCYGIQVPQNRRLMFELGLWFGAFQMGMIFAGSTAGGFFVSLVLQYARYISAILLSVIAIKMFIEGIRGEEVCYEVSRVQIISLAFATSIDALILGFAYSMIKEDILFTSLVVGFVCFSITIGGFMLGSVFHKLLKSVPHFAGAVILLAIAIKALFFK